MGIVEYRRTQPKAINTITCKNLPHACLTLRAFLLPLLLFLLMKALLLLCYGCSCCYCIEIDFRAEGLLRAKWNLSSQRCANDLSPEMFDNHFEGCLAVSRKLFLFFVPVVFVCACLLVGTDRANQLTGRSKQPTAKHFKTSL